MIAFLSRTHTHTHTPCRYLAQSALARGDRIGARRLYEGVVGREACGRSGGPATPWAHAEYGWMLLQEGDAEVGERAICLRFVPFLVLSAELRCCVSRSGSCLPCLGVELLWCGVIPL